VLLQCMCIYVLMLSLLVSCIYMNSCLSTASHSEHTSAVWQRQRQARGCLTSEPLHPSLASAIAINSAILFSSGAVFSTIHEYINTTYIFTVIQYYFELILNIFTVSNAVVRKYSSTKLSKGELISSSSCFPIPCIVQSCHITVVH